MEFPMLLRVVAILCVFSALGGCAFGQKVDYRESTTYISARSDIPIEVNVIDERPYVVSGSKNPTYVGTLRALYYNPFNMNTLTGDPLSFDLKEAIRRSLAKSSIDAPAAYSITKANPGQKLLMLKLKEWKSDTYMRTRFDYDITASVLDENGKELATKSTKGSGAIKNFLTAGSDALSVVLNSDEIVAAISSTPKQEAPAAPVAFKSTTSYDDCMRRIAKITDPALRVSSMSMCDTAK